jgi:hypothetical protein
MFASHEVALYILGELGFYVSGDVVRLKEPLPDFPVSYDRECDTGLPEHRTSTPLGVALLSSMGDLQLTNDYKEAVGKCHANLRKAFNRLRCRHKFSLDYSKLTNMWDDEKHDWVVGPYSPRKGTLLVSPTIPLIEFADIDVEEYSERERQIRERLRLIEDTIGLFYGKVSLYKPLKSYTQLESLALDFKRRMGED